jgi:hypothetical protein
MMQNFLEVKQKLWQKSKRRNVEYLIILFCLGLLTFLYSTYLELIPIILISAGISGIGYGLTVLREFRRFLPIDNKQRILHSMIESLSLTGIIIVIGVVSFTDFFDQFLYNGYTSLGIFIFVFSSVWGENSFRKKYLSTISFELLNMYFENTPSSLFQVFRNSKKHR